jgi:hypothetical protein
LTPFGSQFDKASPGGPIGGLVLPSSSSVGPGEFRVQGNDETGSIDSAGNLFGEDIGDELLDVDFGFDADGNIIDYTGGEISPATPANPIEVTMHSDAAAGARVRAEYEEGRRASLEVSFPTYSSLSLHIWFNHLSVLL